MFDRDQNIQCRTRFSHFVKIQDFVKHCLSAGATSGLALVPPKRSILEKEYAQEKEEITCHEAICGGIFNAICELQHLQEPI